MRVVPFGDEAPDFFIMKRVRSHDLDLLAGHHGHAVFSNYHNVENQNHDESIYAQENIGLLH